MKTLFRTLSSVLFVVLFSVAVSTAAAQDVRVRVNNGVPQIECNGIVQRGRWFWGAPGRAVLKVGPEAASLEFEMTGVLDDTDGITVHFRFDGKPNTYWIDDIQVTDIADGKTVIPRCDFENGMESFTKDWTFWPPGEKNTTGSIDIVSGKLQITLKNPLDNNWTDFHIYHHPRLALKRGHRYKMTLWARAAEPGGLYVGVYKPSAHFAQAAKIDGVFESQIRLAAAVGVDFVSFPVHLPWTEPGKNGEDEFEIAFTQCQAVLDANPKALLVPRIETYPPQWWAKANPDHMMVYEKEGGQPCFEVASPKWRAEAAERLGILIERLEAKFGDSMAGYHPTGQNTAEWFYMDSWDDRYHGNNPVAVTAFRDWLAKKYPTDEALQKSWNRRDVRLSTAEPPTPQRRRDAGAKRLLLDPKTDQDMIDHNFALQDIMVNGMLDMAKVVREKTHGKKLSVLFYGYAFEFMALHRAPAASGHYALRRVLDCPDVDILCSPISYFDRQLGGSAPAMPAAESVMLAGKLWLYEDDTSTHISAGNAPGSMERAKNSWESNQMLLRNTAEEACRNFSSWWMDLGSAGWFDDPAMWAEMKRLEAVDFPLQKNPVPFRPEIAAVIDEASAMYIAHGHSQTTRPLIYESRDPLARCGAPFGQYLLDDVIAGKVDHAKVYVFMNAWKLSPEQRKTLLAKTEGKPRIWCYPPETEIDFAVSANDIVYRLPKLTPETIRDAAKKAGVPIISEDNVVLYSHGNFIVVHGTKEGTVTLRWTADVTWKDALNGEKLGSGKELVLPLKFGETRVLGTSISATVE
jgi:hypothetical protein